MVLRWDGLCIPQILIRYGLKAVTGLHPKEGIMLDLIGTKLYGCDKVAYTEPYYHGLKIGHVMWVTPCGARIMACEGNIELNRSSLQMLKLVEEVL
jgi:hypothetical protein